jgi:hypothetical protein
VSGREECEVDVQPSVRGAYGAGGIASHPFDKLRAGSCKERKDGAPSAWMARTNIIKGWATGWKGRSGQNLGLSESV